MSLSHAEIRSVLERAEHRLSSTEILSFSPASRIDHTLLRADAVPGDIARLCEEAVRSGFAAVCVNPVHVRMCAERLSGTPVHVASVAGFPLGASWTEIKVAEASRAVENGAGEIDAVLNLGALRAGEDAVVRDEIEALARACRRGGALLKIILETSCLDDEQKIRAAQIAVDAGADYVKTSTGFGPGGATPRDVAILRETVGEAAGVKASGGIRTLAGARALLAAGASRLGTSAGMKILEEEHREAAGGIAGLVDPRPAGTERTTEA